MANISETCMLVSVSLSVWSCERNDPKLRKAIADRFGCTEGSVKGGKFLVDPNSLKPISKIAGEVRTENYKLTMPWNDKGDRIIHVNGFEGWREKMADFRRRFEQSAMEFSRDYPDLVWNARRDLNGLFKEAEYPSESAILGKFSFGTKIQKVPESGDFRVAIDSADAKQIRDQIEADVHNAISEAMMGVAGRIRAVISHMGAALKGYDETDKKATRFHDTLVENVRELVGVLPNLNLTGDRRITEIAEEMGRKLCKWDADVLRVSESARKTVAGDADAIARKMEALGL